MVICVDSAGGGVHVGQVCVDQLDQRGDVFSGHLGMYKFRKFKRWNSYLSVFAVEIVQILVQDLNKQVDVGGSIHGKTSDLEGSLQAFQHTLSVLVLAVCRSKKSELMINTQNGNIRDPEKM